MKELCFFVPGIPAPQGSMRAFMRPGARFPVVTADNPKTKPWRASVAYTASQECTGAPIEGAVAVGLTFLMPRPKSAPKRVTEPTKKPDLDKLVRAVFDALKGITWHDDAQVTSLIASKQFQVSSSTGCWVTIQEIAP